MGQFQRIEVSEASGVTVVTLRDSKIIDQVMIDELGAELLSLVCGGIRMMINFSRVQFYSSAAHGKFIKLDGDCKKAGGRLVLCSMIPAVLNVFTISKLDRLFVIVNTQQEALERLQ